MNNTIWKYKLDPDEDVIKIDLPVGANVLTAQAQGDDIFVWAEVDKNEKRIPLGSRRFRVIGTGHPLREPKDGIEYKYISTTQMYGGSLVWHIYEEIPHTIKAPQP